MTTAGDDQLDRIESIAREALEEARGARNELRKLNGQVARNTQGLWGVDGRGGLRDDVHNLFKIVERFTPGMTSVKTVWAAVASIAAVAAVVVSLTVGLT